MGGQITLAWISALAPAMLLQNSRLQFYKPLPWHAVSQLLERLWQAWTCSARTRLGYFLWIKYRGSSCMRTGEPTVDPAAGKWSLSVSAGRWQIRPVSPEPDVTRSAMNTNSALPLLSFGPSESPLVVQGGTSGYEFRVYLTAQRWFWEVQTMPGKNWQKIYRIGLLDNS